ncbi:NAD-dependent succinate-semialdehyde dehydrogenase [Patulibacter sp. SYSU D01012]|uniref:NAD-dependent succinate-semialdehyde dehydrogenase n=1 Tax=Patulibacter sp. SYSU D01012 TaxID=2817381 RepID=UPI001B303FC2|nr:NAD-dependent succinate-semialdehyde dehydrogenase [Patulibacter sp. SYSU D01012]
MAEYAVVDPSTGETLKTYPTISDADLDAAIGRAHAAHKAWSKDTSVADRAAVLRRIAELHEERKQELGEIIVREMGKPIEQSVGEVEFCAAIYTYYADRAEELLKDEPIELLEGEGSALIRRSSLGVLLGIMPWNYPYYQVARFAGPNLLIGNTIVLKHAPQCPESAAAIEQLFQDAGLPADAYVNVYATNEQIETVIADPRVQGVSLTGSGRAGAAVAEIAGRNLKKVVLELGGSDPFILLGADDLDAVVEAAVGGRMENGGQACNAAKRFIVIDELYDAFVEKFTGALTAIQPGDPSKEDTTLGPLSSARAAETLEQQVQRATENGAKLAAGGGRDGNFFNTAVLTDITPENPAYKEEFFGPVAQVYRVSSEQEAIELANDTEFGLGSYVFTTDQEQALRVADQIEAGMVFINAVGAEGAELPFGGVKGSGFGRELGRFGADEFVNKKLIRVAG